MDGLGEYSGDAAWSPVTNLMPNYVGGDGVANDTKPAAGELTAVNLVKLGGVTDVNNLHANNFDFF